MSPQSVDDPTSEYQRRLQSRRATLNRFKALDRRLSTARGLIFLASAASLAAWYSTSAILFWWSAVAGFLVFIALILVHGPVLDRLDSALRSVRYYERALARIAGHWAGTGTQGERYRDVTHLFADDLDLFGAGSLFELICQSRTRLGEDALAGYLREPTDAAAIRLRQQAIEELRHKVSLRETLGILKADVHEDLDQKRLLRWSSQPGQPVSRSERGAAVVLALLALGTLGASMLTEVGIAPFLLVLAIEAIFSASFGRRIRRLARTADAAASGLAVLSEVLAILEREEPASPLLKTLRSSLDSQGVPPSRQIARLERLIDYLNNSLRNQFFVPLSFILCLPVHLVHAIEVWRVDVGPHIADWLRSAGEFEALICLAGFAFEHPRDPFPAIAEGGPCFEAKALGHPLIADENCVRNDVTIDDQTRLVLISGSNMSGKSTMLRTIGTNLVLAHAGAPVRAASLRLSVMQIATAMRIRDSLQSGESLFYAAVSRLKAVVDRASGPRPLLFLFDEILQGTNSHDRLVGSEGILRVLMQRGAVGLITTHDLALTEIVSRLGSKAVNVHFEDGLADGKMTFDYQIRPGVVQRSNALELMRSMGLDV